MIKRRPGVRREMKGWTTQTDADPGGMPLALALSVVVREQEHKKEGDLGISTRDGEE
jgi:hypothetical protein